MERGKYICLEGGDGTGKTTLARAIHDRLGDKRAWLTRFPSDGIIGRMIRQGLTGEVSLESKPFLYLFAADGLQQQLHIQDTLEQQGKHIICDRHPTLSGRVFQPLHHPTEHIESVYNSSTADGISKPDHLFIIDVPVDVALERMANRDKYEDVVFEKHNSEYVGLIRDRYLLIAERFNGTILDGTLTTAELVEQVLEHSGLA
jgi:dTMP kinase